ncbi:MAG: type II secretion system F family protein [Pseudomonadota bacterium]
MLADLHPAVPGLLFAAALLMAVPGLWAVMQASGLQEKLVARLTGTMNTPFLAELPARREGPGIIALIAKWFDRAKPMDDEEVGEIRFKLIRAGIIHQHGVAIFYVSRLVSLIVFQAAVWLAMPLLDDYGLPGHFPVLLAVTAAALGLMLPGIYLDKRISKVERQCSEGFPDMMDLLVACVEAGLSLDAAVLRVCEELERRHVDLSLNLRTLSLEMRAGRTRRDAWRAFADRVGLEEASSLATMLRQSEEMGTSLGDTLRIFSKDMRQRRILIAEEKAMALPAKMTVPLILFVFPVLLGVLIMPAVIRFQSFM